jgi:hypothetical protein
MLERFGHKDATIAGREDNAVFDAANRQGNERADARGCAGEVIR